MSERLVIIDYGSGNLRSASNALRTAARDSGRAVTVQVSADPQDIAAADRLVLPGVGAFGDCMAGLAAIDGMICALTEAVQRKARPFMGICVGMQLLAETGLEHGENRGLGWIGGTVERIDDREGRLKIPHMGWNDITPTGPGRAHPVLRNLGPGAHFYFVHSYAFHPPSADLLLATVEYGGDLCAVVGRDSMIGVQFHPEKSQRAGLALLSGFLGWAP